MLVMAITKPASTDASSFLAASFQTSPDTASGGRLPAWRASARLRAVAGIDQSLEMVGQALVRSAEALRRPRLDLRLSCV